jgi:hypothetical protein
MSREAPPSASMAIASPLRPHERPMTVAAMRAAVVAIRAGILEDVGEVDFDAGGQAASASATGSSRWPDGRQIPWTAVHAGAPVVLAVAAHAGAGASTVALAVAEGLAEARPVQLVDYVEPARSGLVAASTIELGTDSTGWRRGRRGRLDVTRLTRHPADDELPSPPVTDDAERLLVLDAGWSLTRALLGAPAALLREAMVVVVTRVTVPAVRQTEHVLAALDGEVVVAAVGPARWPRVVEASCGPRLGELRSRGRMVRVPVDRRLETAGLTGDQLPGPVAAAGRSLAALLVPAGPLRPRHRRRAARPRTGRTEGIR